MLVKAAPGIRVPREHDLRECITDGEAVEIEMTGYYIRRMSDGDLIEVQAAIESPVASTLDLSNDAPAADETTSASSAEKASTAKVRKA